MDPIKKLINFMEQFQSGMTGFQRYVEILAEDREKEKKNAIIIGTTKKTVYTSAPGRAIHIGYIFERSFLFIQ